MLPYICTQQTNKHSKIMKAVALTLAKLSEVLNLEMFYTIRFSEGEIRLQGKQSSESVVILKQNKIELKEVCKNGYFNFQGTFLNTEIYVTLT